VRSAARRAGDPGAVAFDGELPEGRSRDDHWRWRRHGPSPRRPRVAGGGETTGPEGAGVDPLALFAASIEEIWSVRPPQAGTTVPVPGRCSDLVVGPPHTADGHLWVAHNNDLGEASEADILAVEWRVPGEPVVFSLGIGPWISVGWNSAGLSLTGNELSPNDERVGVPRLLMVRQQLTAGTIDEAIAMALRPIGPAATTPSSPIATVGPSTWRGRDRRRRPRDRARRDARSHEPLRRGGDAAVRGRPGLRGALRVRHSRACALLAAAERAPAGSVTPDVLRSWLSDHEGAPDSICRHRRRRRGRVGRTVFWSLADVTAGEVVYGRGNPCEGAEPDRHAYA